MLKKLRRIALFYQGLTKRAPYGNGKAAVNELLEHIGYLQIDTLAVVERAHHHTLWVRMPKYQPQYLYQLVREGKAFEYWSHAASYLPMRDYRYALPKMAAIKRGELHYFAPVDKRVLKRVYDRIRIDGPLKARDFKTEKNNTGSWWNWKPAKQALEKLFMQGDLMICDRHGMEKVYDLTERVLPENISTSEPSIIEFAAYLVDTSLKAHGFATFKHILHLRSGSELRQAIKTVLEQKIETGTVVEHQVNGLPSIYAGKDLFDRKINIAASNIRILSPFDNLIIHRDRLKQLFAFDYSLECYVPKHKRRFGYFCLPILYQDEFVGRVDCKAHRNSKQLEIIHLHLKKIVDDNFVSHFVTEMRRFSAFNHCECIVIKNVTPRKLKKRFQLEMSK